MTESTHLQVVRKSALDESHALMGATMKIQDGWSVPASYEERFLEYAAVRGQGAGLVDLSSRGRLLVSGSEAVAFLNGLITNDMKTLGENRWMPAAFPNVQGRLIASVRVIRIPDEIRDGKALPQFLIDTETMTHNSVLKALNRFTLAGDFRVMDLTDELSLLSLQGNDALRIVRAVLGKTEIEKYQAQQVSWLNGTLSIVRATHTAENGFDLLANAQEAARLWKALLDAGARPVGFDTMEVLRIEAGQPRYGIDMDDTNVVSESNLDDAISFTKGCYIGQEIIARIKYRGHVAKKLTGLIFEKIAEVEPGTKVLSEDEKDIGRLRSVTFSPMLNRTIALGYVKYDYLASDTRVSAISEAGRFPGVVSQLPFVRGSWYTK